VASVPDNMSQKSQEQSVIDPPLNMDAFDRLRWKVFDDIHNLQVTDAAGDMVAVWRPFIGHLRSVEFATQPPVSTVKVDFGDLNVNDFWGDACLEPPASRVIGYAD
jgi:hypothetical protein